MIELLFSILITVEIAVFAIFIFKINTLKNSIAKINGQINEINAEEIVKTIKDTVSKANKDISAFVQAQKIKELTNNIKLVINLILTLTTLIKNKNNKT